MILSFSKKFAILLPWKTASSTIHARIGYCNESPHSRFFHYNKDIQTVTHQHITLIQFLSLPISSDFEFKAAFVRNPYDRAWSAFRQIRRDIDEQPNAEFPENWIRELVLEQLAKNRESLTAAGGDFDTWIKNLKDSDVFCVARNSNLPIYPLHFWTHFAGNKCVDFVGKVEKFERDFNNLVQILEIEPQNNSSENVTKEFAQDTPDNLGYKYTARMHNSSIDKINRLFAEDFELFGYAPIVRP